MKSSIKKEKEALRTLVNEDNSLNVTTFYTKTGKWQVCGSSKTHDECYNRATGERIYRTREQLKALEVAGHIFDVGK